MMPGRQDKLEQEFLGRRLCGSCQLQAVTRNLNAGDVERLAAAVQRWPRISPGANPIRIL